MVESACACVLGGALVELELARACCNVKLPEIERKNTMGRYFYYFLQCVTLGGASCGVTHDIFKLLQSRSFVRDFFSHTSLLHILADAY